MTFRYFLLILSFCVLLSKTFAQGSENSLSFNGINRYIDLGDQVGNGVRTIEIWFKPAISISSSITSPISLLIRDYNNGDGSNLNEFGFYFSPGSWGGMSGGSLVFYRRVGGTFVAIQSNSTSWQAGVWYHVAGVIDNTSGMKMYVNGVLQTDTDPSTSPIQTQSGANTDMVAIGTWGYWGAFSGNRFFNGEIDEVRLWTIARSQTEIRNKMCSKFAFAPSTLKAYYRFDNTSGNALSDASGNAYNGLLIGFPSNPWHYSSAPIGDTSTYVYPAANLNLQFQSGDVFSVSNISGNSLGNHIYRVNSLPNSATGTGTNTQNNYYGVFLTGTTGNYDINYNFSYIPSCGSSSCGQNLYSRNDNAVLNWTQITPIANGCSFSKANESSVGVSYRAEYIISTGAVAPFNIPDSSVCSVSNVSFASPLVCDSYNWSNGDTNQTTLISGSGSYWLNYSYQGCNFTDSFTVNISTGFSVNLGNDTTLCQGSSLTLNPGLSGVTYLWNDNSASTTLTAQSAGTYWVQVNQNGCSSTDSIIVQYNPVPTINIGNDTIYCDASSAVIFAQTNGSTITWSDNSTGNSMLITGSGTYYATTSLGNCVNSDTISVSFNNSPVFSLGNDTGMCNGGTLSIHSISGGNNYQYFWNTGSNSDDISVFNAGPYWLSVTENGCTAVDTINILYTKECSAIIELPNIFSPNDDQTNDYFIPVKIENVKNLSISIYNRWGQLLYESENINFSWNGTFGDKPCPDGTYYYIVRYQLLSLSHEQKAGYLLLTR